MDHPMTNSEANGRVPLGSQSCPYLGVYEDPQTHVAVADVRNYCHLMKPPQSIALSYQDAYCLSQNHQVCEVFLRGRGQKPGSSPKPSTEKVKTAAQPAVVAPGDEMLRNRLREEALRRYQDVTPRPNRIWAIILGVALLVLVAVSVGFFLRYRQLQLQTQRAAAESAYLSTAMYNIGSAADIVATTKAELIARENAEATADALTATAIAAIVDNPTLTPTPIVVRISPTITATQPAVCQDVSLTKLEIATGPNLSPQQGYQQIAGTKIPPLLATWTIKNTGNCAWQSIALWSLDDNVIITPAVAQNGQKITPTVSAASGGIEVNVAAGESIDITVTRKFTGAWQYKGEWVLVINGLTLSAEPHLILDVKNWVVVLTPTPSQMPVTKPTKPANVQPTEPASRPTATQSSGR